MWIRPETTKGYTLIDRLVRDSFATAAVSDGTEQDLVLHLRAGRDYLPELALTAWEGEQLIGYLMFTRFAVPELARPVKALLAAPLAVLPGWQRQRVGTALMRRGLEDGRRMGFDAVFLLGDPAYYSRHGFLPAGSFGIREETDLPAQYVQACPLYPGALDGAEGSIAIGRVGT